MAGTGNCELLDHFQNCCIAHSADVVGFSGPERTHGIKDMPWLPLYRNCENALGRVMAKKPYDLVRHSEALAARLTPRQEDILRLVVVGKSNKEVASALGISERTVKQRVSELLVRLNVTNRVELAALWFRGRRRS
jgi:DNA-binding CsgD family transcriptional regulator